MLLLALLREKLIYYMIYVFCPAGLLKRGIQAGPVAAVSSEGGGPSGHASRVCNPVETLFATFAA